MNTKIIPLALTAAALAPSLRPGDGTGGREVHFKVLGTLVAPDGKIKDVKVDRIGLPAGTQTRANDNFVPTVAIEYFLADSLSVETIAGVTEHDVDGRGALAQGRAGLERQDRSRHGHAEISFRQAGQHPSLYRRGPQLFHLHQRKAGRDDTNSVPTSQERSTIPSVRRCRPASTSR